MYRRHATLFQPLNIDVVSTLHNVKNLMSDFLSFSMSGQPCFQVDPKPWHNIYLTLRCWLGMNLIFLHSILFWSQSMSTSAISYSWLLLQKKFNNFHEFIVGNFTLNDKTKYLKLTKNGRSFICSKNFKGEFSVLFLRNWYLFVFIPPRAEKDWRKQLIQQTCTSSTFQNNSNR